MSEACSGLAASSRSNANSRWMARRIGCCLTMPALRRQESRHGLPDDLACRDATRCRVSIDGTLMLSTPQRDAALEELIKRIASAALNVRHGGPDPWQRVPRHVAELPNEGFRQLHGAFRFRLTVDHLPR